ncbi:MAG: adenylate/guanylate cyclase domain-containing protein [Polyangiaceae bacterium]|nr:adenylate/guanylate cyclase domain-containing protein [Polyangiaceae bacterium]
MRRRVWRRLEEGTAEERELAPVVLDSERTRVRVMIGVFGVVCLGSSVVSLASALGVPLVPLGSMPPPITLAVFAFGVVAYELLTLFGLRYVERRRLMLPDLPRYGNTFAEVSFVSLLLLVFARVYSPVLAFETPVLVVYAIPIILSTLRLSFGMSLFAGATAGVEYVTLAFVFASARPQLAGESGLFWYLVSLSKGVLLALSGAVAGIVALQIRKRIDATLALARERQKIVSTFGQYISPAVAERLLGAEAPTGSELRSVTVMFLDIRGFTRFSEKKPPEEVVAYLNRLFGFMIETVNRHNGLINKFLGDGFMALFGAPFSDGRDSQNATTAAREIVTELAAQSERGDIPATRVGIGIHSGPAVVGTIGSSERKEYTVIGDTVNLASRVEQLTKELDSSILVTEPVFRDLGSDRTGEELPAVRVKGRDELVRIYKLS